MKFWKKHCNYKVLTSKTRTEYTEHKFSNKRSKGYNLVNIASEEVAQTDQYHYLRSIIYINREIEEDVINKIKIGWLNKQILSRVLYGRRIHRWRLVRKSIKVNFDL